MTKGVVQIYIFSAIQLRFSPQSLKSLIVLAIVANKISNVFEWYCVYSMYKFCVQTVIKKYLWHFSKLKYVTKCPQSSYKS